MPKKFRPKIGLGLDRVAEIPASAPALIQITPTTPPTPSATSSLSVNSKEETKRRRLLRPKRPSLQLVEMSRKSSWSMDGGVFKSGKVQVSPSFVDHNTGSTVCERDIVRLWALGKGQNRSVWAGIHLPTSKLVAIKTCDLEHTSSRHQTVNELETLSNNKDPNIVKLHGAHIAGNDINVVLELMNGGSLGQYVRRHGPLTEEQLACVAKAVLKGVRSMHRKSYVHGDIKPDNILLNKHWIKLSDFGLSKEMPAGDKDIPSESGTKAYMAPEQHLWKRMSFSSDVWSFGLTMMFLATGKPPFEAKNYWELLSKITEKEPPTLSAGAVSATFHNFIEICLKKDPQKRPTVDELLAHPFTGLAEETWRQTLASPCKDQEFVVDILKRLYDGLKANEDRASSEMDPELKIKEKMDELVLATKRDDSEAAKFLAALADTLRKAVANLRTSRVANSTHLPVVETRRDVKMVHLRSILDQMGLPWDPRYLNIWESFGAPRMTSPPEDSNHGESGNSCESKPIEKKAVKPGRANCGFCMSTSTEKRSPDETQASILSFNCLGGVTSMFRF